MRKMETIVKEIKAAEKHMKELFTEVVEHHMKPCKKDKKKLLAVLKKLPESTMAYKAFKNIMKKM
jgi:DNA-binding FrmR family transcriptional regulator